MSFDGIVYERNADLCEGQRGGEAANAAGPEVRITVYGGIVVAIHGPDRHGVLGDVSLGYDRFADYVSDNAYFGTITGRYANRIARGRS